MADPDYVYDPDDWEYTCHWGERLNLTEDCKDLRHVGDVKQFNTLVEGPPKFAAKVAVTRDEAGDPDEIEIRWFDTEAEAHAACGMPPYMTDG